MHQEINPPPAIQPNERRPNNEISYFLVSLAIFIIVALVATDSNIFVG